MGLNLSHFELEFQGIHKTDLHELVKFKIRKANEYLQAPVIVEDTSLYFIAWNELPRPLVKFFLKNLGLSGMVRALDEFNNNSACAICCLGFTKDGERMQLFEGIIKGVVVNQEVHNILDGTQFSSPKDTNRHLERFPQKKHQISPRSLAAKKFNHFLTLQAKQK